jgi:hypothetical protein
VPNNRRLLASATLLPLLAMLAGCVGSSVSTPLSPGSSGSGASPAPSASSSGASPNPSVSAPVTATWTFGGTTANLVAVSGQTPALVTLSPYQGIAHTIQFGAVTLGSGTITVTDALNNGADVTPSTLPADNATAGATPISYVSFYNGTLATIGFGANTPTIHITDTAGFGTAITCELDVYSNNGGSSPRWGSTGAIGTIAGTSVTINSTAAVGGLVEFQPGQQVTAIACK